MKKLKYLLVLLLILTVASTAVILWKNNAGERGSNPPPTSASSPLAPPVKANVAQGVKVTKNIRDTVLFLEIGTVRPHVPKQMNFLQTMMEHGNTGRYKLSLRKVKLRLEGKGRFLELEAARGLSNEEFTDMMLKGVRISGQKGFKFKPVMSKVGLRVVKGGDVEILGM